MEYGVYGLAVQVWKTNSVKHFAGRCPSATQKWNLNSHKHVLQICSPSGSEALHKEASSADKTLKVGSISININTNIDIKYINIKINININISI